MHVPVLAEEVFRWLCVREEGVYVDCTVGTGGHARRIAERLTRGRLIALDRDPVAVEAARRGLATFTCVTVLHRNYAELDAALAQLHIEKVDGVVIDAGVSSLQLDDSARGFSFQREGPLDMRMDTTQDLTAEEFLARINAEELTRILKNFGDVRRARRMAAAIVRRRQQAALRSTSDLAAAVADALGGAHGVADETRRVFQAVRIAVNDELRALELGLRHAINALAPRGRLVCIAFHSGEDRIAKNILRDASRPRRELHPDGRLARTVPPVLKLLTPRPIRPTEEEVRANPRAQSGRLRAAERLSERGVD